MHRGVRVNTRKRTVRRKALRVLCPICCLWHEVPDSPTWRELPDWDVCDGCIRREHEETVKALTARGIVLYPAPLVNTGGQRLPPASALA
jgi:hypothetical protein